MPKFFVNSNNIENNKITINNKDVEHIKRVLRKNIGDKITICNIDTSIDYLCEIINIEENIECNILEQLETNSETNIKISIFQGLPKSDKMELIIQKSVELGVFDITPIEMNRCVVKLNEKDKIKKIQRWQKISEVASKQSGRNIIPKINEIKTIKNICNLYKEYDIVIVAYEKEDKHTLKEAIEELKEQKQNTEEIKIAVVIGPEGGIAEEEIQMLKDINNVKIVTLGNRILRTETVALNILSILMYELERRKINQ